MSLIDDARALVGLTEDDDAYRAIVDPSGPYAEQVAVAHAVSSCMLCAAWLRYGWRGRFIGDTIQNTLRHLAGGTGRVPDVDNLCEPGAGLWWAAAPGHEEHVDCAVLTVKRPSLYAATLTVVAGGQRNAAGRRSIAEVMRRVEWDGAWVDQGTGRRLLGVLEAG